MFLLQIEVNPQEETLVRVHQPLSLMDLLDVGPSSHSWTVHETLTAIADAGKGVLVLLNCSESAAQLIEHIAASPGPWQPAKMDLLTYGIGAQILRDLKVGKMKLLATPRKMPSMAGFDLEVSGFIQAQQKSRGKT